ncbi:MAG: NUDIX domain-containing protein [Pseudooceanicola atlanticus]
MIFLFGTLRYEPLLKRVSGEELALTPARLPGWRIAAVKGKAFPMLVQDAGSVAEGVLIDPSNEARARIHHYEDAFAYLPQSEVVTCDGESIPADLYRPTTPPGDPDGAWSLEAWIESSADRALLAAAEIMSYQGRFSGGALQFRFGQIEARAQSRVRAGQMPRPQVGSDVARDKVDLLETRADHAGYFVTTTNRLSHPTFGGDMSEPLVREVFHGADAAIVLPYDPSRDRILLVDQFRMGPWGRGATYPWQLEPVAGRIDPGESPEACARRETEEEAGLVLQKLLPIGSGYPSPGCVTEYFYIYVGLCDLPDGAEGHHGVEDEAEDIRTHILDWAQAEDLLTRGEADNVPLILALVWLSRERSRLRALG